MKRALVVGLVAIGAICGHQLNAFAGRKSTANLTVTTDPTSSFISVSGALGSVRNSADASEYHGCSVNANSLGTYGVCESKYLNVARVCSTWEPHLIEVIMSIKGDSLVKYSYATTGAAAGDCTSITVENASNLAPK